ncbi:uncharacterized protein isoform X2 [Salmo salar]|uniref:Uncharacterized protein isoform X2 n=1 Tax=Salmo salar TaxID=8030 RepID=A0A1S3PYA4_SALSA|nr:uncharacterized protein LOC106588307 isoform X2 [Salmo salar]
MSVHLTLNPDEDRAGGPSKTSGSTAAGPQTPGAEQGLEHRRMDEEKGEEDEKQEAKKATSSAALEPSTLLWLGDREGEKGGVASESEGAEGDEEREEEVERRGGSTELLEGQESQPESERKAKWRESMPEGERWRDDVDAVQGEERDGSLADDEEEGEEGPVPEKVAQVFTPTVIVRPSSKREEFPLENSKYGEMDTEKRPFLEPQTPTAPPVYYYPQWTEEPDNYTRVLVQGLARLRYGALTPLYEAKVGEESREVAVHRHYVGDSLSLFLLYFLQLAVMATYISQDLLKLVPLLTIVFAFGRLIYWVCVTLGSSVRGLGFGLSFLPILVMLGANLYFVCSSLSEGAVFDVAPPTTPPPRQSWWG